MFIRISKENFNKKKQIKLFKHHVKIELKAANTKFYIKLAY